MLQRNGLNELTRALSALLRSFTRGYVEPCERLREELRLAEGVFIALLLVAPFWAVVALVVARLVR